MTQPATGDSPPFFSLVTPVHGPSSELLAETIESVLAQPFQSWELILVHDGSPSHAVREQLRAHADRDRRIRVIEGSQGGGVVAASNDGLVAATGEFVALLDQGDLLARPALRRTATAIGRHPDVDFVYSDEDRVDDRGELSESFHKPAWSPERLRGHNYCGHLSVLRRELVREVGGFREGFEGAHDHDLVLRVSERARRIVHLPEVLYHVRGNAGLDPVPATEVAAASRRAVQDHLDRVGVVATVEEDGSGHHAIARPLPAERRVSIVIPTIGSSATVWDKDRVLVVEAVRSALLRTRHPNLEVVVVYDEPTPPEVLEQLKEIAGSRLVLVPFREKFNFSRKMNFGVLAATGDRLILLNDDVEALSDGWVEELLAPLEEPDVGMTGAKLLFSSDTVQHAGVAFSRGYYMHPFRLAPRDEPGPFRALAVNREVSAVTGACAGVRRDVFLEVGGLAEELPENFNDVDFAYKVSAAGYRILAMARCELYHFETQTRTTKVQDWEYDRIRHRWGTTTRDDYTPDYPNLPRSPWRPRPVGSAGA